MLIDQEDKKRVNLRKWSIDSKGYYQTSFWDGKRTYHVPLHHYLIGRPLPPLEIDHLNRKPLDNRKVNLRIVTKSQNIRNRKQCRNNTSGHTGVNRFLIDGKYVFWQALGYHGEHLGCFKAIEEAIEARRKHESKV